MSRISSWVLENKATRLIVDRATGRPASFVMKPPGIDLLQAVGRAGSGGVGVAICDEVTGQRFSDPEAPVAVPEGEVTENRLRFVRWLAELGVEAETELALEDDHVRWTLRLQGRENRTLRASFLLPLPVGWRFWAPAAGTPRTVEEESDFEYSYLLPGNGGEIHVPVVSVYSREQDAGITLATEFARRAPGIRYRCHPQVAAPAPYLEVCHPHLAVWRDSPAEVSVLIHCHEGDWRPGLEWLYARNRPYFDPGSERIHEQVGTFLCGNIRLEDSWETYLTERRPHTTREERMARLRAIGFRCMEIHDHFPHYGLYAPEEERWRNIACLEHPDSEIGFEVTYQEVRGFVDYLHRHDVRGYIYLQFSQCDHRYAEARFPESIARDERGDPIPAGWPHLYVMNPDLRLPWGRYCVEQAEKLLAAYPEMDGLFLDCCLHRELDFGHDDGVTSSDGRGCASINFAYDAITEVITGKLRERRLVSLANKPRTIQQMKGIDCVVLEGRGKEALTRQFFLCLARPMIYMWMEGTPLEGESEERYLKECLLYGAFPQVSCYHNTATAEEWHGIEKTYQGYLPLLERLRGRKLAFDPDPLQLPAGVEGQVFTNPTGDHVVSVISEQAGPTELRVTLREPPGSVLVMLPGDEEPGPAEVVREGQSVVVRIPASPGAALVEFRRRACTV